MGERRVVLTLLLILYFLMVIFPNIELVRASESPLWNIEPNDISVSYWYAPPESITEPTTIIIISPENRTYATSNVTLTVNLGTQPIYEDALPRDHYIRDVDIKVDWMESTKRIFYHMTSYGGVWYLMPLNISITLDLTGIPEGNHDLKVIASDSYAIVTTSTVNFTIDSNFQETTIPEFLSWAPLLLVLIVFAVAVVVYRRRLPQTN